MPMEIERVKTGRSSGNHGAVTKPASSLGNLIEGSKEETEILAEVRRCCTLKNLANPIEKGLNICAVASQIVEYSSESYPILLNSRNIFSGQRILTSNFAQTLGAFNETVIRGIRPT
jgi:hypothetical protein